MRVELSGISCEYGKDSILSDVDLTIESGSFTVICGHTGSGKSTLLQIAAGLQKPTAGRVIYQARIDKESHRYQMETIDNLATVNHPRRQIGIVFQLPEDQLFAGTVREDVEYGLKLRQVPRAARLPQAERALRMAGLEPADFLERSPFLLSGGQKRRVAIAGALVVEPQVLILDEPTAGLDPAAAATIGQVLRELRDAGITILVSTHDLDMFFPLADQVAVLRQGRISYAGAVRELLGKVELLQEAGLALPAAASIANRLRQLGLQVETALHVEELLPSLRGAIYADGIKWQASSVRAIEEQLPRVCTEGNMQTENQAAIEEHLESIESVTFRKTDASLLDKIDPRAKWLGMVMLSIAMLSVTTLWGVIAAAAVSFTILRLGRIRVWRVSKLIRPFVPMFVFLWLIGAVSFGPSDISLGSVGISYQGALRSGLGVCRFVLIIILGVAFSETTTGAPLREGLEWMLRPLRKLRVPTRDISLAVTIAVQFLPWVLERIWQLRKAAQSRGQDTIGLRRFSPAQLTVLLVPLLLSLIKMGDELATAIEARGYNRHVERISWYELVWQGQDTAASLFAMLAAGLLLFG